MFRALDRTNRERERERQRGKKNISRERQKDILFRVDVALPSIRLPCRYSHSSSNDGTRGTPRATTRRRSASLPFRASSRCSQTCSRLRVRACAFFLFFFFFFFFFFVVVVVVVFCEFVGRSTLTLSRRARERFVLGERFHREFTSQIRLFFPA